jgi:hypothetical protein
MIFRDSKKLIQIVILFFLLYYLREIPLQNITMALASQKT